MNYVVKEILLDRNKLRQMGVELDDVEELKMCKIIDPMMEGEES